MIICNCQHRSTFNLNHSLFELLEAQPSGWCCLHTENFITVTILLHRKQFIVLMEFICTGLDTTVLERIERARNQTPLLPKSVINSHLN